MTTRAFIRIVAVGTAIVAVLAGGAASYSASGPAANAVVVVRPGDTLWGIATANGLTVDDLAAANGMAPSDLLLIGRSLEVPMVSPAAGAIASPAWSGGGSPGSGADFCAVTSFYQGPYGSLPSLLQAEPDVLALRPLMVRWADAYGVAPALLEAVAWQESGWQQGVTSGAGAIGVGQLLPATADFVNNDLLGTNLSIGSTSDNIEMMSAFLAYLIRQVGDNPCMVAAAYYQGPTALKLYGVFPETQQYVSDVIALEAQFE